jgi:HEAT repeat protein
LCFAAGALGELRNTRAFEPLFNRFSQPEAIPGLRAHIAAALGKFGDGRALSPLLSALRDEDEDVVVRIAAAEGLGWLGDAQAIPALEHARQFDTGTDEFGMSVRSTAKEAIKRIKKLQRHR